MQLSKRFELFLNIIFEKSKKLNELGMTDEQNRNIHWGALHLNNIIQKVNYLICDELQSNGNHQEYAIFQNNIINGIDINGYKLNQNYSDCLKHLDYMSQQVKELIESYIDIIIDEKLVLSKDDKFSNEKAKYYFNWLYSSIYHKWKLSNFKDVYQEIEEFNKLATIFKFKYIPVSEYSDHENFINNVSSYTEFVDIIKFMEKLKKQYEKTDKTINKLKTLQENNISKEDTHN